MWLRELCLKWRRIAQCEEQYKRYKSNIYKNNKLSVANIKQQSIYTSKQNVNV